MKIVVVQGSPHGLKGNTGALLDPVLQGIRSFDPSLELKLLLLSELTVKPCNGCFSCSVNGACPITDDLKMIRQALLDADGIIFSCPNYVYNVNAQMKAFIDRIFGLIHCQLLYHKHSAVVVSGGGEYEPAEEYLLDIFKRLGCWNTGSIGMSVIQQGIPGECDRIMSEAALLGVKFAEAITENTAYPDQANDLETNFEMMKALVTVQKDEWKYEYACWQKYWGLLED